MVSLQRQILFLLMLTVALPVLAEDTVFWLHTDLYPYIISEGPQAGRGAADYLMDALSRAMGDLMFRREAVPNARLLEELRQGRAVLYPTALKSPEREAFMYFSRPYVILNGPGIVVLSEHRGSGFDHRSSTVDLALALADPDCSLVVVRQRRYGEVIDAHLASAREGQVMMIASMKEDLPRVLDLLRKKRVSGIVGYEDEIMALLEALNLPRDGLEFLWPKDAKPYLMAHIAAPRNTWGKAMIERIDTLLPQVMDGVAERYSLFLAEGSRKAYRDLSKKVLMY